jgi:predicted enzyme related to lactoylglutathione lyase
MSNAIVHFEIPVDDVQRAQQFYKKAFGWKFSDPFKMGYHFVETRKAGEEGINGGMMLRKMPAQPFMNYIMVKSIEKSLDKVVQAGGVVCLPKQEIGQGMGWIACFQDTEHNMMGFYQPGPGAKPAAKKPAKKKAKKSAAKK